MRTISVALLALTVACGPDTDRYTYGGYDMSSHFPLDGSRLWEYLSDSPDVSWTLEVEKTKTATASTYEVITLEHVNGDTVESFLPGIPCPFG